MRMRGLVMAFAVLAGMMLGAATASAQGVQFFAVLNGGNEIDAVGYANAGDPNGYGAAAVIYAGAGRICVGIAVFGLSPPTAAHIHRGEAGTNGPIVVTLPTPNPGGAGTSSGCVTGISASLLNQIRSTPGNFYVNVHTGDFTNGAVRGQLR